VKYDLKLEGMGFDLSLNNVVRDNALALDDVSRECLDSLNPIGLK
jgi:hypothetical protein